MADASSDDLSVLTRADTLPESSAQVPPAFALLVDKPPGMTSFGVVKKVRWLLGIKKVGHAGTLDPMATGLLILLLGRNATRQQDRFMGLPKVYTGTLRLGETTASYDAETPVDERKPADHLTDADVEAARQGFVGEIEQQPPIYSAIKVGGERLYKKARRGETNETVAIKARPVTITRFDLTARRGAEVDFIVECSKGTYIRSLAHDFGEALGVGGHLTALRREAIGPFGVDEAWTLDALEQAYPKST